jgi:ABC-type bacteriocin/lantibiotic exporter with double-glycine peptidase domain
MAIQTARPLADRARPILLAEAEAARGRADPGILSGDIQASGLTFGYDNAMAPLINGLSFVIRPGEHLAIVGGSGSGKSTILRLLLGFETPTTGSLAFDGQELASLDPVRVRAQIGVVLQSSQLFAGTIFENIRGATQATLEDCMAAAAQAGLQGDLDGFPMGLHTMITEGAGTLSGGQRQRILIDRALAAKPRILFFDEATSALDNATQAIVARTLDQAGATRVTIAHRLSTVRNADRICVLERGRFVESGTFTELMARNGAFAELARRQLLED